MTDWQNWIVAGIVIAAAWYVLREAWLVCAARKQGTGSCGSCTGCTSNHKEVVTLGVELPRDKQRS